MATAEYIKQKILQMEPGEFQCMCDAYLAQCGYSKIEPFGLEADTKKTTPGTPDSYCLTDKGRYVFIEYTTQKVGITHKIESDIRKCLDVHKTGIALEDIATIICCHTSTNISPSDDQKLRRNCGDGIELVLIGINHLAQELLTSHQWIARDYLNIPIDTNQIFLINEFIKQYDTGKIAAPLDTEFLFRENELLQLERAFKNNKVVVVTGAAGVGKSRLALHYASQIQEAASYKVLCIRNNGDLPIYDDLYMYIRSPGKYLLLVDDANQLSGIKHIIDFTMNSAYGIDVSILMTVRDYALQNIRNTLLQYVDFDIVNISVLSDEQISELVKRNFHIRNKEFLEQIVTISEGNARIAMFAGRTACKEGTLRSIYDVSDLYQNYFTPILNEAVQGDERTMLCVAGVIAAFGPLEKEQAISLACALGNIDEKAGLSAIETLHKTEIVDLHYDNIVQFAEQCFSNYILKYVMFDRKLIDFAALIELGFIKYRERTLFAIQTLLSCFRNNALEGFVAEKIRQVWFVYKENQEPCFFEFVQTFTEFNPTEALLIVKKMIEDTPTQVVDDLSEVKKSLMKNHVYVTDRILQVLGNFSTADDIDSALDLFFQYFLKRPDLYAQFYHASNMYFVIDKETYNTEFETQKLYIHKIAEHSNDWTEKSIVMLFLDVAGEM